MAEKFVNVNGIVFLFGGLNFFYDMIDFLSLFLEFWYSFEFVAVDAAFALWAFAW